MGALIPGWRGLRTGSFDFHVQFSSGRMVDVLGGGARIFGGSMIADPCCNAAVSHVANRKIEKESGIA
jgi:hypothetical protein